MSQDNPNREGHIYDGIEENDYPLPGWWTWSFLLSIIFAFLYYIHYEFAPVPDLQGELQIALDKIEQHKKNQPQPLESEDSLSALMSSKDILAAGKAQYESKCTACHGDQLQGGIGPNLTDPFWLHGKGTRMDVVKVIREGVPDKGMPPWGPLMKKDEVIAVAAYIINKKGSNPPGAKAPQGEKVN